MFCFRARLFACSLLAAVAPVKAQAPALSPAEAHADSVYRAGDYAAAATAYAALAKAAPNSVSDWARWGIALQQTGKLNEALAAYAHTLTLQKLPVVMYNVAAAHAKLGDVDLAFDWLDSTVAHGFTATAALDKDADFSPLRSDPRYAQVMARMQAAREPCVSQPESHEFDFWVGEWNVTNTTGQPAGHSVVKKILADCVVFENWTDGQGGEGKSINAYNAKLKRWQQFWMDQYGAVTEYRYSDWDGKSLRLVAHVPDVESQSWQRMTFTPTDSNTVRQFGQASTDGGKTWTTSFDLYYHRIAPGKGE